MTAQVDDMSPSLSENRETAETAALKPAAVTSLLSPKGDQTPISAQPTAFQTSLDPRGGAVI
jgi:hypothetical protein